MALAQQTSQRQIILESMILFLKSLPQDRLQALYDFFRPEEITFKDSHNANSISPKKLALAKFESYQKELNIGSDYKKDYREYLDKAYDSTH
jgi:hypothetical protein